MRVIQIFFHLFYLIKLYSAQYLFELIKQKKNPKARIYIYNVDITEPLFSFLV
jgi:hypothetical protein